MDSKSPCINVCVLDNDDICQGCYRTAEEISNWQYATKVEKQDIVVVAKKRKEFIERCRRRPRQN